MPPHHLRKYFDLGCFVPTFNALPLPVSKLHGKGAFMFSSITEGGEIQVLLLFLSLFKSLKKYGCLGLVPRCLEVWTDLAFASLLSHPDAVTYLLFPASFIFS